jgi:hypothetical protein
MPVNTEPGESKEESRPVFDVEVLVDFIDVDIDADDDFGIGINIDNFSRGFAQRSNHSS